MLSLMVVLSAYYLFTDDLNRVNDIAANGSEDKLAAEDLGATYDSQFASDDVITITDEEILAEVESMQASARISERFDAMQFARDEELKKRFDDLYRIVTDPTQSTEAISQAYAEHYMLEEQYNIIQNLEDQLMQQYGNAIIEENDGEWHVQVMADNLEKSQAVSIIETVAEQLGVSARDVFVSLIN
jgi:stage III sporulation protein AH